MSVPQKKAEEVTNRKLQLGPLTSQFYRVSDVLAVTKFLQ